MRRLWPLAFLVLGCGGGGVGDTAFIEGTVGTASVQFVGSVDADNAAYNGNATPLTGLTALDGSASSGVITITATANDRAVEAVVVARNAKTGSSVDLSDTGTSASRGSDVVYTDAIGKYQATTGTIAVQSRTTSSVTLLLTNVVCEAVSASGAAKGRVTLNGTLSFTGR